MLGNFDFNIIIRKKERVKIVSLFGNKAAKRFSSASHGKHLNSSIFTII